jgi:TPR repeat protein
LLAILKYENVLADEMNLIELVKYFKMAADAGSIEGMTSYGQALQEGWSGNVGLQEAAKFFKMAADTGSTYGMMKYSQSLREGMDEKI